MKPISADDKTHIVVGQVVNNLAAKFEEKRENEFGSLSDHPLSKFHSRKPPRITIPEYMIRIQKYTNCSPSCYLIALVYIDRVVQLNHPFTLNKNNVHRYSFSYHKLGF